MSVFFIAEAGVNHNGDIELAKELITAAKESGADAVKFQNFKASRVISTFAYLRFASFLPTQGQPCSMHSMLCLRLFL